MFHGYTKINQALVPKKFQTEIPLRILGILLFLILKCKPGKGFITLELILFQQYVTQIANQGVHISTLLLQYKD